jgi:mycoredoxin
MKENNEKIILYTSRFCGHSRSVERFLAKHEIPVQVVNIDRDPEARARLVELNAGYASVPTLVFPDGKKLTEPPLSQLRQRFGIESDSLGDRLRSLLGGE